MMRANVNVSGAKPGGLVQLGVSITCGTVSRAVRTVSWFTNWPPSVRTIGPVSAGPKRPPPRNWAKARAASEIAKLNTRRCLDVLISDEQEATELTEVNRRSKISGQCLRQPAVASLVVCAFS